MANPEAELPKVCGILNRHKVDYLLVGGMAVSFHGYARTTADIDFWYAPTHENYHKLLKALDDFDVDTSELDDHVFDPKNTFIRFLKRNNVSSSYEGSARRRQIGGATCRN